MQRLEHVSLQSPVLPQDFAPTFSASCSGVTKVVWAKRLTRPLYLCVAMVYYFKSAQKIKVCCGTEA